MMTISSQTSQADGSKTSERPSECSSSAHGQTSHIDALGALLNAACSDLEGPRSLADPQGSDSQDRTPGPPSHCQNSHYNSWPHKNPLETGYKFNDGIHEDSDTTPTWCSSLKSQRKTPSNDSQSEGDASSLCRSDKENLSPRTPYQVVVSVDGHRMSFEGLFDRTGRDGPVDMKFTLPTLTESVSIKLSMMAERKEPLSRSTSYHSWKSKGAKRADRVQPRRGKERNNNIRRYGGRP
ncbi:hypothetical protein CT0861_00667 [Colletotrichum tofieldiae]|uniref:Uncharacterized protein n=1 Tax=Colletotrichum tofieldiae TaxID=708197 RepID=A0A166N6R5_9PEZI|nr:hypothetical protein CT0861_00667 [Colletotrichum tofieldiae]